MQGTDKMNYNVDICLVIDKTDSMDPIMDTVKSNALNLYRDITGALRKKNEHLVISQLRIRLVLFGDYLADYNPMMVSDFLTMPDQAADLEALIRNIKPHGGGDTPEDGLEALAFAIRSDWCRDGFRRRHIIALFTDAPAHPLGYGKSDPDYPKEGMPADFGELSAMWGDEDDPGEMEYGAKRLLLFAPDQTFWHTIKEGWENVVHCPVNASGGLSEVSYKSMLNVIANSVSG